MQPSLKFYEWVGNQFGLRLSGENCTMGARGKLPARFSCKKAKSLIGIFCGICNKNKTNFFMNIQRVEREDANWEDDKGTDFNWISSLLLCLLIQIAQDLIKRSISAALFIKFTKESSGRWESKGLTSKDERWKQQREDRRDKVHSPSLHSRCALARASPANL